MTSGSPAPDPPELGARRPGLTRDELVAEVAVSLERIPVSSTVVVAVSGGPDSTACAFLVAEARPDLMLVLGHVRHGLRNDEIDLGVVRTHASWLGVDLEVAEVVVEADGRGVEAEARSQRYAALRRMARDRDAGWLVVAHTADDQAETLLLRLARGTGVPGLGGMAPVRGDVVRPLLAVRRADVHRFVALEGLPVARDPSNDDLAFARNRVRAEILPALEKLGQPDVVGALARLAELAREDARTLDDLAAARLADAVHRHGPVVMVPRTFLEGAPALTRRAVRALVMEVRVGADPPTAGEVEAVRCLQDGALDLAGVRVGSRAGWTALGPAEVSAPEPADLEVPGTTQWRATRCRVDAWVPDAAEVGQLQLGVTWRPSRVASDPRVLLPTAREEFAGVTLGGLEDPSALKVRARRPGDRIATAAGTRKLQDVYVDAGVPRQLRDLLPLVVSGDRVLWVPGLAVDAEAGQAGEREPQCHLVLVRPGSKLPPG